MNVPRIIMMMWSGGSWVYNRWKCKSANIISAITIRCVGHNSHGSYCPFPNSQATRRSDQQSGLFWVVLCLSIYNMVSVRLIYLYLLETSVHSYGNLWFLLETINKKIKTCKERKVFKVHSRGEKRIPINCKSWVSVDWWIIIMTHPTTVAAREFIF